MKKFIKWFLNIEYEAIELVERAYVKSLPYAKRLVHPKSLGHIAGITIGCVLMIIGSIMSTRAELVELIVPKAIWDAVAYLVHGIGCVPILRHIEPLWDILLSEVDI